MQGLCALSALHSRQRHTHSFYFLQAASAARIASGLGITSAAEDGDVERVRDHLFADPTSVHVTNDSYAIPHTDDFEKQNGILVSLNFVTLVFLLSEQRLHCICLLQMVTWTFVGFWSSAKLT